MNTVGSLSSHGPRSRDADQGVQFHARQETNDFTQYPSFQSQTATGSAVVGQSITFGGGGGGTSDFRPRRSDGAERRLKASDPRDRAIPSVASRLLMTAVERAVNRSDITNVSRVL